MDSRGLLHVKMRSLAPRCRDCRFGVGATGVDDQGEAHLGSAGAGRQAHVPRLGLAAGFHPRIWLGPSFTSIILLFMNALLTGIASQYSGITVFCHT